MTNNKQDESIGYCRYHETKIDLGTFEWKGCWTCCHFDWSDFPFLTVDHACEIYGVSRKTIYRWIKKGKLKALRLVMGRRKAAVPRVIYLIPPNQPKPSTQKRKRIRRDQDNPQLRRPEKLN